MMTQTEAYKNQVRKIYQSAKCTRWGKGAYSIHADDRQIGGTSPNAQEAWRIAAGYCR